MVSFTAIEIFVETAVPRASVTVIVWVYVLFGRPASRLTTPVPESIVMLAFVGVMPNVNGAVPPETVTTVRLRAVPNVVAKPVIAVRVSTAFTVTTTS